MTPIPVVDLSRRGTALATEFAAAAARVAASGTILLGPETAAFEREFAAWLGAEHAVSVASGASALQLALRAVDVGPGDEVIVPALTAIPTAAAVCATGATPVFADVDAATATLDPAAAAGARTDRTKAVIPVHLYGHPATIPDLPGVAVVEDAAQAHGAVADHARSAAVAYSFYPTKNLGGIGDGGSVATADPYLARQVRLLRTHGLTTQPPGDYVHTEVSQNFRMSELESAWLRLALPGLAAANARRAAIVAHYRAAAPALTWHAAHPAHVYHLAVVRVPDRPRFQAALADAGVASAVHYARALTQQPAYARFVTTACPQAEAWAAECVSVPCFPELSDLEVEHVASALADAAERSVT
jgi:dTDP-4-amino-4,6-dideoxygalactose transaminase